MSNENNFIPEQESYKVIPPFQMFMKNYFPFIENTFAELDNYNLLCKVTEYLNNIIANENNVESNVTALYNAFVSLNNYVSHYFDNLDVQEEINNKLDDLVEDGTLGNLILPFINEYEQTVNAQMLTQNNRITSLESRMDTFTNLPDGSTSGDAELADARDAYDGFQYVNVGNHIRSQIQYLNKENLLFNDNKDYFYDLSDYFEQGNVTISSEGWEYLTGTSDNDRQRIRVKENATLSVKAGDKLVIDSEVRAFIGMRTGTSPDYTYTNTSWLNDTTYEFQYDCDICILASLNPQANLPSIKNVFYYLHLIRKEGINQSINNLKKQNDLNINGGMCFDNKLFVNSSGVTSSGVTVHTNKSRIAMTDFYTAPFDMYFLPIASGYRYAFCIKNSDNTFTNSRWLTEGYVIKEGTQFKCQIGETPEDTTKIFDLNNINVLQYRVPVLNDLIGFINNQNTEKMYLNPYTNFIFGAINISGVMTNVGQKRHISTESYISFPFDIKLINNQSYYMYVAMYNDDLSLKQYTSSYNNNNNTPKGYVLIPKNTLFRITLGLVGDTSSTELSLTDSDKAWFNPAVYNNRVELETIRNDYVPAIFLPNKPRNILHRGNERVYTENSIPAFESGAQIAFAIETDVRETSDGVLICMHDTSVNRTTNAETVIGEGDNYVQNLTYSQIESLTINDIPSGMDASVPTFEEYLQICKKYGCVACVEIKTDQLGSNYSNDYATYISKIIAMIKKYGMEQSCFVMNFQNYFGHVVRRYSKIIHVGYLRQQGSDSTNNTITEDYINAMVDNSSVVPSITTLGLNKSIIQYAHSKNHLVIPYGISNTSSVDYTTWLGNDSDCFIVSQIS